LERWILLFLLRFHSNRIIQTRIFLYVCKTPAAVAAAAAPAERHGDASATKAPASPAFPAVVTAAASAAASETSRRRRHAASASAPKIQTSIFCTGVVSEIQNDI
jgi:hypothetical protein